MCDNKDVRKIIKTLISKYEWEYIGIDKSDFQVVFNKGLYYTSGYTKVKIDFAYNYKLTFESMRMDTGELGSLCNTEISVKELKLFCELSKNIEKYGLTYFNKCKDLATHQKELDEWYEREVKAFEYEW